MSSMILSFYLGNNSEIMKQKADASIFTIADGIVQHLLVNNLFKGKFLNIVGEEDSSVNLVTKPYTVDDLIVPECYYGLIDQVNANVQQLSSSLDGDNYRDLTVFVDPIDGTKEFSTGLGEQCSVCIGFSDLSGHAVAGLVYRPIPQPNTWAAGAQSENFFESELDLSAEPNKSGFLTSNGSISPFLKLLMAEMNYDRVPSGGAGNKVLMLLEGKGSCYIQDRGVSRWDTCAAEAVVDAYGGLLRKLSTVGTTPGTDSWGRYCYLQTAQNLDFVPGLASLTPYNTADKSFLAGGLARAMDVTAVKPYANLCGLVALSNAAQLEAVNDAVRRVSESQPPSYD